MTEDSPSFKATLEMELDGRAPAGVLTGEDGLRLPFTGWTELASAIERWREAARSSRSETGSWARAEGGPG